MAQGPSVQLQGSSGFPLTWQDPSDAELFWTRNSMHFPGPVSPMDGSLYEEGFAVAFTRVLHLYAAPVREFRIRRVNGYLYESVVPATSGPAGESERHSRGSEDLLKEAYDDLDRRWRQQLLPEAIEHFAGWDACDLTNARLPGLLHHLEDTIPIAVRCWEIHLQTDVAAMVAVSEFAELYVDLFHPTDPLAAYALIQGFDNRTLEVNRELWRLGAGKSGMAVCDVLKSLPPKDVSKELEQSREGRAFIKDLAAYLDRYGQRAERYEVSYPSWVEDPTLVLKVLGDFAANSGLDPESRARMQAAERERLVADARETLRRYPRTVAEEFEGLLRAAQVGSALHESSAAAIEFPLLYRLRRVLLEVGLELVSAGTLEAPEDIFYLTLGEVLGAASGGRAFIDLVGERRAEVERFATVDAPPMLGRPGGPPPDDALGRMLGKLFGGPPAAAEDPSMIKGSPGSAGVARGPAKVVRSLAESTKVNPGDILVTETTAPPWTPLFSTIAAVVTDAGGVLSHCALVAREYGIPAVVGARTATGRIRDGQLLEVDGNLGLVRILSERE